MSQYWSVCVQIQRISQIPLEIDREKQLALHLGLQIMYAKQAMENHQGLTADKKVHLSQ